MFLRPEDLWSQTADTNIEYRRRAKKMGEKRKKKRTTLCLSQGPGRDADGVDVEMNLVLGKGVKGGK